MGINNESISSIQSGLTLIEGFMNASGQGTGSVADHSATAEEQARMVELDAKAQSSAQQTAAGKEADSARTILEKNRANDNTAWGQSNLAMSGSKALVKEAVHQQDLDTEEDLRFEGEAAARETLDTGVRQANLLRISQGVTPDRSTLSLGSRIYTTGR